MKYGILGNLSREDMGGGVGKEMSAVDDVLAEEAFMDASDIAHESAMDASDLTQGIDVLANLSNQEELTTALNEGTPTSTEVVLAHECVVTSLTILGADVTGMQISTESMVVSHEGIGSTMKKIMEGVKMIFKKIALSIKKLAVKLVVAMNGVSKKAEKLLKSFKADSGSIATEELSDKDIESIVNSEAGAKYLSIVYKGKVVNDIIEDNLASIVTGMENTAEDTYKLLTTAKGNELSIDGIKEYFTRKTFKSTKFNIVKNWLLNGRSNDNTQLSDTGYKITPSMIEDFDLGTTSVNHNDMSFAPTHTKGNRVYGVLTYISDVNSTEIDDTKGSLDPRVLLNAVRIKATSHQAFDDNAIEALYKDKTVISRDDIVIMLTKLKSATKYLKTVADRRLKSINKLTDQIDKTAKAGTGITMLNKLANTEFNQIRMIVANTYISSIFSLAAISKTGLRIATINMSYYK